MSGRDVEGQSVSTKSSSDLAERRELQTELPFITGRTHIFDLDDDGVAAVCVAKRVRNQQLDRKAAGQEVQVFVIRPCSHETLA